MKYSGECTKRTGRHKVSASTSNWKEIKLTTARPTLRTVCVLGQAFSTSDQFKLNYLIAFLSIHMPRIAQQHVNHCTTTCEALHYSSPVKQRQPTIPCSLCPMQTITTLCLSTPTARIPVSGLTIPQLYLPYFTYFGEYPVCDRQGITTTTITLVLELCVSRAFKLTVLRPW